MRGTILNFSIQTNQGLISGDNGNRYEFSGSDWKLSTIPEQGTRVDFDADGNKAFAIYLDPTKSQQIKTSKSRITAGLLAIFVGGFGIHYFYIGAWGWGLISILFCWTYIPAIVALVYGVHYLGSVSDEEFKDILKKGKDPLSSGW
jgi:TM2 domain-containing membrane protein YozV